MKRIIFLLLVSLLSLTAMAQELTIKSFELTTSLDGKKYARLDANDHPCALIKVQLALPNAVFEGNVVGDVAYKTSEYWVYMYTGSTKMLTVKADGVLPLRVYFPDYGIERLEGNTTYVLTLLAPDLNPGRVKDNGMSFLAMQVSPANATVKIDGNPYPLDGEGTLMELFARGTHTYQITATGYKEKRGDFTLGTETLNLRETLLSSEAQLTVSCPTEGAQIYINKKSKGTTPKWSGKMFPSTYLIEVQKEGYYPQSETVTLTESETRTVNIPALVGKFGDLQVAYKPIATEVLIDGKRVGTSPNVFKDLPAGQHQVELRSAGYASHAQTVTIEEGKTATLSGSLAKLASTTAAATSSMSSSSDIFNGHAYVDLGLKDAQGRTIYWATCNVGADKPEDAGLYFAWGETVGYGNNTNDGRKFDWANYKWCRGSREAMTKYCVDSNYGTVDNKTVLDPADDAAHVNWGGGWRMPTRAEQDQLREKCTWTWDGTKNGYVVKGPNGKTIFLPAAGYRSGSYLNYAGSYGYYWSSSLCISYSNRAYGLSFDSSNQDTNYGYRYYGRSVRAVCVSIE